MIKKEKLECEEEKNKTKQKKKTLLTKVESKYVLLLIFCFFPLHDTIYLSIHIYTLPHKLYLINISPLLLLLYL